MDCTWKNRSIIVKHSGLSPLVNMLVGKHLNLYEDSTFQSKSRNVTNYLRLLMLQIWAV